MVNATDTARWVLVPMDGAPSAELLALLAEAHPDALAPAVASDFEQGLSLLRASPPGVVLILLHDLRPASRIAWSRARTAAAAACRVVLAGDVSEAAAEELRREGAHEVVPLAALTSAFLKRAVRYGLDRRHWERDCTGAVTVVAAPLPPVVSEGDSPTTQAIAESGLRPGCLQCEMRALNIRLSDALVSLKRAQSLLIQSERQLAVGQVTSRIMHDFNNALMPIMGYTDLLIDDAGLMERRTDALMVLTQIRTATQQAAGEIRQLRQCYLPHPSPHAASADLDLNTVVQNAIEESRARWAHTQVVPTREVELRVGLGTVPAVPGHAMDVRDAIANVLLNAFEALRDGGCIEVSSSVREGLAVVTVRDNGPGMMPVTLERCCEPFYSTKGAHAAGIGLAVAQGVARAHGGRLVVESEHGRGACVSLELPLVASEPATDGQRVQPADQATRRPLRILVVDDDVEVLRMLGNHLERRRHSVAMAIDGHEAVSILQQEAFDLMIADWAMPKMDGSELVRQTRAQGFQLPILMLTGLGDVLLASGSVPPGVARVLCKPVSLDTLDEAVASLAIA